MWGLSGETELLKSGVEEPMRNEDLA